MDERIGLARQGRTGRRTLALIIVAAVLVLFVVGAVALGGFLWLRPDVPPDQRALEKQLELIESQDVDALLEGTDLVEDPRQRVLLDAPGTLPTESVPEDVEIRDRREIRGVGVQYLLELSQGGESRAVPYLMKNPQAGGSWTTEGLGVGTLMIDIPSGATAVHINGEEFTVEQLGGTGRTIELLVLPGRWTVEAVAPDGRSGTPVDHDFDLVGETITLSPGLGGA